MKALALALSLSAISVSAAPEPTAAPAAPSPAQVDAYTGFLQKLFSPAGASEFAAACDHVVAMAETPDAPGRMPGPQAATTKLGLHVELGVIESEEAILYYLTVSRNGEELKFSEGVKLISFAADRIGLPHPITIKEGERPFFYAQWLFKPKEWKKEHKLMLQVREKNRAEKDPLKAFAMAISRELQARQTAPRD